VVKLSLSDCLKVADSVNLKLNVKNRPTSYIDLKFPNSSFNDQIFRCQYNLFHTHNDL